MSDRDVAATLHRMMAGERGEHRTIEGSVTSVIRDAIVTGVLAPGERLQQDRLANALDVSRMPIRAALSQLESEGLVSLEAHRGATVTALSSQEVAGLYEIRVLIETLALRKTIEAATPEDIEALVRLARAVDRTATDHEFVFRLRAFYRALFSIGNSPRVVTLIMQVRAEVYRSVAGLDHPRTRLHGHFLDLVAAGDADAAVTWLGGHLEALGSGLQGQIEPSSATAAAEG